MHVINEEAMSPSLESISLSSPQHISTLPHFSPEVKQRCAGNLPVVTKAIVISRLLAHKPALNGAVTWIRTKLRWWDLNEVIWAWMNITSRQGKFVEEETGGAEARVAGDIAGGCSGAESNSLSGMINRITWSRDFVAFENDRVPSSLKLVTFSRR